jgi:hypothetical protein
MIFWGRNLDETLETQRRRREVVDISAQRQRLHMTSSVGEVVDDQPRFTALDSQQGATLESAFKQTLLATGTRLVDRNASVRATHAQGTRSERNAQLVEADAILSKADLLVEVEFVPDAAAPLAQGFKVSVKAFDSGAELASFYTAASPALRRLPGRYVATEQGFAWVDPPAPAPSALTVGTELAQELMRQLLPVLENRTSR